MSLGFIFLCSSKSKYVVAGKASRIGMSAGKASTKRRVQGKPQPTGFLCSACKPDYHVALAMGMHPRLGQASPLGALTDDLLRKIIEATKLRRTLPAWMSCSWNAKTALTRPRDCSLVCYRDPGEQSRLDAARAQPTRRPSQTAQERQCNRLRAQAT
jgi:hypothetical protein